MMNDIAAMSTGMSSISFMTNYTIAVTKQAMDAQETIAQNAVEMLKEAAPQVPAKGQYIDVYA